MGHLPQNCNRNVYETDRHSGKVIRWGKPCETAPDRVSRTALALTVHGVGIDIEIEKSASASLATGRAHGLYGCNLSLQALHETRFR